MVPETPSSPHLALARRVGLTPGNVRTPFSFSSLHAWGADPLSVNLSLRCLLFLPQSASAPNAARAKDTGSIRPQGHLTPGARAPHAVMARSTRSSSPSAPSAVHGTFEEPQWNHVDDWPPGLCTYLEIDRRRCQRLCYVYFSIFSNRNVVFLILRGLTICLAKWIPRLQIRAPCFEKPGVAAGNPGKRDGRQEES